MYSSHIIHAEELFKNIITVIEHDNGHNIEITTQSEAAFQTEGYMKLFHKKYNKK